MELSDFRRQILILVSTYNRRDVTKLCLSNLCGTKSTASLWLYDDCSSEYGEEFLREAAPCAEKIFRAEKNMGIDRLRYRMHLDALESPYRFVYHTDNDAFHDPHWIHRLHEISQIYQGPIGLYNSRFHIGRQRGGLVLSRSCPGISFFYDKNLIPKETAEALLTSPPRNSWDYVFGDLLKEIAISQQSYVEHFGANGLHNSDFERDRAMNPTPYLRKMRPHLLAELTNQKRG